MAEMIRAMTPILLANALTIAFVYGFWRITKWEREGRSNEGKDYRIRDLLLVIVPLLVAIYGLHLWGFTESTPFRHLLAAPPQATTAP